MWLYTLETFHLFFATATATATETATATATTIPTTTTTTTTTTTKKKKKIPFTKQEQKDMAHGILSLSLTHQHVRRYDASGLPSAHSHHLHQ